MKSAAAVYASRQAAPHPRTSLFYDKALFFTINLIVVFTWFSSGKHAGLDPQGGVGIDMNSSRNLLVAGTLLNVSIPPLRPLLQRS
jgi:hypothetical protein